MSKTHTKGNVIVEEIKVGDIHYEYEMGIGMKLEVVSLPKRSSEGQWTWQSKMVSSGKVVNFLVTEGMSHYSANLYDYEAYKVNTML